MEDAIDSGATGQLGGVDLVSGSFYTLLKVHRELLHHPAQTQMGVNQQYLYIFTSYYPYFKRVDSLQQSFGLTRRIIRSEVLVLLHLLLYGEELTLQFGSQTRESVTDVVGELLQG